MAKVSTFLWSFCLGFDDISQVLLHLELFIILPIIPNPLQMSSKKTLHKCSIHKNFDFWIKFLLSNTQATIPFLVNTNNEPQGINMSYFI